MNDSAVPKAPRHVTCPTCHKPVAWVEMEIYRPFCSKKCQLIDFGEWAAERHGIPADDTPANPDSSESDT